MAKGTLDGLIALDGHAEKGGKTSSKFAISEFVDKRSQIL